MSSKYRIYGEIMLKKLVVFAVIAIMLSVTIATSTLSASAVDLPIDIDVIGRDGGSGQAYTANVNVEILTPEAGEISEAINEHHRQSREAMASELFYFDDTDELITQHEQITNAAVNSALFSQPSNYSGLRMARDDGAVPVWLIILIFAVSIALSLVIAYTIIHRRKREE